MIEQMVLKVQLESGLEVVELSFDFVNDKMHIANREQSKIVEYIVKGEQ